MSLESEEYNFQIRLISQQEDDLLTNYQIKIGEIESIMSDIGEIEDIEIEEIRGMKQFLLEIDNVAATISPRIVFAKRSGSKEEVLELAKKVGEVMNLYLEHSEGDIEFEGIFGITTKFKEPNLFDKFNARIDAIDEFQAVGFNYDYSDKEIPITLNRNDETGEVSVTVNYGLESAYGSEDAIPLENLVDELLESMLDLKSKLEA